MATRHGSAMLPLAAVLAAGVAWASPAAPPRATPRIISLDQCADQYVLALAPRDEIAAVSKRALNDDSNLRALAVGLPERRPTLEAALGARATIAVRYWTPDARLADALRRQGVTVVQLDDAHDFAAIRGNIRKVAAALNARA